MAEKKTFYITTPIYYPSGKLTIGNAYTTIAADTMTRYKKSRGFDTFFLTGTDEHGLKIEQKAEAQGIKPQEFVDKMADSYKDLWKMLDVSYDRFIRTTDEDHVKAVQKIFERLLKQGWASMEEQQTISEQYNSYHALGGDSFITDKVNLVLKLPVAKVQTKSKSKKVIVE